MTEVPVGRITGVFGVHGELKCDPTSAGRTLFVAGASLHCGDEERHRAVRIAGVREHKGRLLLRLEGVEDANAAAAFAGAGLYAERERIALEPDEHLDDDLVGCAVFDVAGAAIGSVTAVDHYPSSDMLIVNGKMIPMVRAFIRDIDTTAKRIVVELPAGLLD